MCLMQQGINIKEIIMQKENFKLKNLFLRVMLLFGFLVFGCFIQNSCIASDESQLSYFEHSGASYSELEQYITLTRNRIKNNWYPPVSSFENSAIVGLSIDRSGKLVKFGIIKPSSSKEFDNSLLDAVKKTKYLPLPKDFVEDIVDFSFEFGMQRRNIEK